MELQEPAGAPRGWPMSRPSGAVTSNLPRPLPALRLTWQRPQLPRSPRDRAQSTSLEELGLPVPIHPAPKSGGDSGVLEWASKISQ